MLWGLIYLHRPGEDARKEKCGVGQGSLAVRATCKTHILSPHFDSQVGNPQKNDGRGEVIAQLLASQQQCNRPVQVMLSDGKSASLARILKVEQEVLVALHSDLLPAKVRLKSLPRDRLPLIKVLMRPHQLHTLQAMT